MTGRRRGYDDSHTNTIRSQHVEAAELELSGLEVDYAAYAPAFEAVWRALAEHGGYPVAAARAIQTDPQVRAYLESCHDGRALDARLLMAITQTPEFVAYRLDLERGQLIAAEHKALAKAAEIMGTVIVREHRQRNGILEVEGLKRARKEAASHVAQVADELDGLADVVPGVRGDFELP